MAVLDINCVNWYYNFNDITDYKAGKYVHILPPDFIRRRKL